MDNNERLRELGELLAGFIEGQHLPPALFSEIQDILDALLILLVDSGAHLPAFIMQGDRLEGARRRLGAEHIDILRSRPLTAEQRDELLPLTARMCSALDTLQTPLRGNGRMRHNDTLLKIFRGAFRPPACDARIATTANRSSLRLKAETASWFEKAGIL